MASRSIYKVYAQVTVNGVNNTLSGYPKTFDSKDYGNDATKAFHRAEGAYHQAIADMCGVYENREQQSVMLMDSACNVRYSWSIGQLADVSDETEG